MNTLDKTTIVVYIDNDRCRYKQENGHGEETEQEDLPSQSRDHESSLGKRRSDDNGCGRSYKRQKIG